MRRWMQFLSGVLVGLGIAAYLFSWLIFNLIHHMFIIGVSHWSVAILLILFPAIIVVAGLGIAWKTRINE